MNVIKCKNGHFFDGDSYSTCPHCGETAMTGGSAAAMTGGSVAPPKKDKRGLLGFGRKEKEADVQPVEPSGAVAPRDDFGSGDTPTDVIERNKPENSSTSPLKKNPTLDFWQRPSDLDGRKEEGLEHKGGKDAERRASEHTPDSGQPEAEKEETEREKPSSSEQSSSLREAVKKSSASTEGKTMSYFSSATSTASAQTMPRPTTEPVVGWLVCVGGCHLGECFSIYAGKNSVGRSDENRIIISDDNSISRIKHALIVYEPKKRNFYLQPGDSSGLTYLNDDYITDSHKLTPHDMIELGNSKFMFVPLCGEAFSWEDHMPKGE